MSVEDKTLYFKTKNSDKSELHIVVSKKIAPKATQRNLLKRRIKESLKKMSFKLPQKKSITLYVKKGILEKNYKEINKEIDYLIKTKKF